MATIAANEKEVLEKMGLKASTILESKGMTEWVAKTAAERKKAIVTLAEGDRIDVVEMGG